MDQFYFGEVGQFYSGVNSGQRLARVGDSMSAVRAACGEPRASYDNGTVEHGTAVVRAGGERTAAGQDTLVTTARTQVPLTRWEYSLGSGQFLRLLDFEGDRLVRIELGPRQ